MPVKLLNGSKGDIEVSCIGDIDVGICIGINIGCGECPSDSVCSCDAEVLCHMDVPECVTDCGSSGGVDSIPK